MRNSGVIYILLREGGGGSVGGSSVSGGSGGGGLVGRSGGLRAAVRRGVAEVTALVTRPSGEGRTGDRGRWLG